MIDSKPPPLFPAPERFGSSQPGQSGFALVSTILIIAVLTIMVVAFLQSMRIDQLTARSYLNKTRADEAARASLAMALEKLSLVQDTSGNWQPLTDFNYAIVPVTGTLGQANEELQLVKLEVNTGAEVSRHRLASSGSVTRKVSLPQATGMVKREVKLEEMPDAAGRVIARTGFLIEDESGKLNITQAFGRTSYSAGSSPRENLETLQQLPFIPPGTETITVASNLTIDPVAYPQLSGPNSFLPLLSYANYLPLQSPMPAEPLRPAAYTAFSEAQLLAPDGSPKLDLRRLKLYVDQLAVTQTAGNPRARVVESLIGQANLELRDNWGGGHLEWLTRPAGSNPAPYTLQQARQIAANLIDYLDEDKFPTTDNIQNPSYFGVEGWIEPGESVVRGHPVITGVGTGMVFNRSTAAASAGGLNSTRVLSFLNIVNPWGGDCLRWDVFYEPEIEIEILGSAAGGNLGPTAQAYFLKVLNEQFSNVPGSFPGNQRMLPQTGFTFPGPPNSLNYANFNNILGSPSGRQPPGMIFSDLAYRIVKLRLRFEDTDGREGYVQVLDGLNAITIPANPNTASMGTTGGSLTYKFTNNPNKQDLHLNNDFRLNFRSNSWLLSRSSAAGDAPFTTNPTGSINVFNAMDSSSGDGVQDVSPGHTWYQSNNMRKHLRVASPPEIEEEAEAYDPEKRPRDNKRGISSLSEIGFLHTGLPWRTLRLHPATSAAQRDWELLSWLTTGTQQANPDPHFDKIKFIPGLININTANRTSLLSLFADLPGKTDGSNRSQIATWVNDLIDYRNTKEFLSVGEFALFPRLGTGFTDDFDKERAFGLIASGLTTTSRSFTIYAYGEAMQGNRVVGRSLMAAEVILESTPSGIIKPRIIKERIIQ